MLCSEQVTWFYFSSFKLIILNQDWQYLNTRLTIKLKNSSSKELLHKFIKAGTFLIRGQKLFKQQFHRPDR